MPAKELLTPGYIERAIHQFALAPPTWQLQFKQRMGEIPRRVRTPIVFSGSCYKESTTCQGCNPVRNWWAGDGISALCD